MITAYCSIKDVKDLSRVTPNKIGLDKGEADELDNILQEWILQASALINDYTNNPLTETDTNQQTTKYYVYRNIATRIVANMCALSAAYKSHSVVKVNDWSISTVPSEVFPVAMKKELENYNSETSNNSTAFGVLTVKGGGIFDEDRDKVG